MANKKGGSATLYGVLYQLLGSIHEASLLFEGTKRSGDLIAARLTFEPAEGGDLQTENGRGRIVQQWKSRRTNRPWTIRDIIRSVLPDLVRAVDIIDPNQRCEYWLMTEGRCSDWKEARRLFAWMKQQDCPDNPAREIERYSNDKYRFYGGTSRALTAKQFFQEVVTVLRRETHDDQLCPRRIWHLLAHFDIHSEILAIELKAKIDSFIANQTNSPDDVEATRGRLCALVLDLASDKGRKIEAKEFFRMAELDTISLSTWRKVFGNLNGISSERIHTWFNYDHALDVRPAPEWPHAFPILLIVGQDEQDAPGESGKGKSFTLGAIGHHAIGAGRIVRPIRDSPTAEGVLQDLADYVWKSGFQRRTSMSLGALSTTLEKECPGISNPWAIILLDDLQSPDVLRQLTEVSWSDIGVWIAAATTNHIAAFARKEFQDLVATM